MAPKLKQKYNITLLFLSLPVLIVLIYIFRKCYNILVYENSRRKDEENWWMFQMFMHKDGSEHTEEISILGTQLYVLLFHGILEDFITCLNLLVPLIQAFLFKLSNFCIFVAVLSVLIVTAYFLLIRSSCSRKKRKSEANKKQNKLSGELVKDERSKSFNNRGNAESCYHGNRKYLKWLTGVLFSAFLLTIPWEFVRMYQSAVAEKVAHMMAGTPAECIPQQMTAIQSMKSWLRWTFSWSADPCHQYQKALLVDPLWHVSPLKVISSALSHCVVYPVELLLGGLGRALRVFFAEIPAHWQPVMLVIVVIFCLLTLVMWFGYRIHLPFMFKFEPKTPVYLRIGESKVMKLKNERKNSEVVESGQDKKKTIARKLS